MSWAILNSSCSADAKQTSRLGKKQVISAVLPQAFRDANSSLHHTGRVRHQWEGVRFICLVLPSCSPWYHYLTSLNVTLGGSLRDWCRGFRPTSWHEVLCPWGFCPPVSTRCLRLGRASARVWARVPGEKSSLGPAHGLGEAFSSAGVSLFFSPVLPSGSSPWVWILQVSRWWFSFRVLACSGFSVGRRGVAEAAAMSLTSSGLCMLGGASAGAAGGSVSLELQTQWSQSRGKRCRPDSFREGTGSTPPLHLSRVGCPDVILSRQCLQIPTLLLWSESKVTTDGHFPIPNVLFCLVVYGTWATGYVQGFQLFYFPATVIFKV